MLVSIIDGRDHFLGHGSVVHFGTFFNPGAIFQDKLAVSLTFVAFAYSGWNAAAYLGGEIENPGRNIPLTLLGGTFFIICLSLSDAEYLIYLCVFSERDAGGA